jgi:hypothetical protein
MDAMENALVIFGHMMAMLGHMMAMLENNMAILRYMMAMLGYMMAMLYNLGEGCYMLALPVHVTGYHKRLLIHLRKP